MKIYVGNLPYEATADELRQMFSQHGEVTDVHTPTDRETGRPRGFAFVEMANDEEAKAAMQALDGTDVGGRAIKVNEARSRGDRPPRGGGGGRGGYGGGGGGGGGGGRRW